MAGIMNVERMSDCNAPNIMISLKDVQDRLPGYWTDQGYPDSFNGGPLPHRHYNHQRGEVALAAVILLADKADEC